MEENKIREIIDNYIDAYNNFDIDGMMKYLDDNIEFKNITKRRTTLKIQGKEKFREQAKQSADFFKEREQKVKEMKITGDKAELKLEFKGIPVVDFPLGQKIGNERIKINGRSVFKFKNDKIVVIEDYS